jgi:transposase
MNIEAVNLPNNVSELKAFIVDFAEREYKVQRQQEEKIILLTEEIRLLKHRLFGRTSEKLPRNVGSGQLLLFNEAEQTEAETQAETQEDISVPGHKRRRGKRRPLPADIARVEVIHDIAEEDKQCACGAAKSQIGQVESEQLDYVPPQYNVIKNIRLKYACKQCEGTEADEPAVSIAPMPEQLLPKSIATPGLMAHIITSKYADALPLYRQEKIFERLGVELRRNTMASWIVIAPPAKPEA